jgi:hypothetical protein
LSRENTISYEWASMREISSKNNLEFVKQFVTHAIESLFQNIKQGTN